MPAERDRLFFALWPDEPTRAALAAAAGHLRQRLHPVGRWVDAQRYHLTLHFLGDYPGLPETLVQRAMEAAATLRSPRFELRLEEASSFRDRSIPWWLGPAQASAPLRQLWRDLREALQARSVPYDTRQRLVPHVTVLRDATQFLAPTPVPVVSWPVDGFALIHSHLGADSRYRVLETWRLQAPTGTPPPSAQRTLWDP